MRRSFVVWMMLTRAAVSRRDGRYKELGAEKGGHDRGEGVTWGETWKELYYIEDGLEHIEKSAEKWTSYSGAPTKWSEKWSERFSSSGSYVKSVEKNGSDGRQTWTERWGESYADGKFHNYTDKFASSPGARWGDRWDEDFDRYGNGSKNGETWREEAESSQRWSRAWWETHDGGVVRKYGRSSSGEQWDVTSHNRRQGVRKVQYTWNRAVADSKQLIAISKPPPPPDERPPI